MRPRRCWERKRERECQMTGRRHSHTPFPMRSPGDICCIRIDPLDRLPLLCDHAGELSKDLTQLGNGRFDALDGRRPGLDVRVLGCTRREGQNDTRIVTLAWLLTCCSTNCIC